MNTSPTFFISCFIRLLLLVCGRVQDRNQTSGSSRRVWVSLLDPVPLRADMSPTWIFQWNQMSLLTLNPLFPQNHVSFIWFQLKLMWNLCFLIYKPLSLLSDWVFYLCRRDETFISACLLIINKNWVKTSEFLNVPVWCLFL